MNKKTFQAPPLKKVINKAWNILREHLLRRFELSMDEILKFHSQMKDTKPYFSVVLFIMLCKVILAFESVDENPKELSFK